MLCARARRTPRAGEDLVRRRLVISGMLSPRKSVAKIARTSMRHAPRPRSRRAAAFTQSEAETRRAALTIRIDFGEFGYLGPGKIALMERISKHGSISAAGRDMGMSYRRAWLLVDEINQIFRAPLVETQLGGSGGGGAHLTKLGRDVVGRYRAIEGASATACAADLRALKASLALKPFLRFQDNA